MLARDGVEMNFKGLFRKDLEIYDEKTEREYATLDTLLKRHRFLEFGNLLMF